MFFHFTDIPKNLHISQENQSHHSARSPEKKYMPTPATACKWEHLASGFASSHATHHQSILWAQLQTTTIKASHYSGVAMRSLQFTHIYVYHGYPRIGLPRIIHLCLGFSMKSTIQRAWGTPMTMETPIPKPWNLLDGTLLQWIFSHHSHPKLVLSTGDCDESSSGDTLRQSNVAD